MKGSDLKNSGMEISTELTYGTFRDLMVHPLCLGLHLSECLANHPS